MFDWKFLFVPAALAIVSVAAACSSTTSSSTSQDAATSYCDALRAHSGTCNPNNAQPKYDECLKKDGPCAARLFSAAAITSFNTCMRTYGCSASTPSRCECQKSDDDCFFETGKTVPASPKRDAYESACRLKLDECGKSGQVDGGIQDDLCTPGDFGWELYADATYDALIPCFAGACADVNECARAKRNSLCAP